ncbi:MAG: T9SS type A sorting domain-containing protein, partial [bacterium]
FQIPIRHDAWRTKSQIPNDNVGQGFSLVVYDVTGRLVKQFNHLTNYQSSIIWCGEDTLGRRLPAGIYFIELKTDDYSKIQKVILLR